MAGIDLLADKWTDIVFENKNKAYGAYDLRKRYNRLSIIAVLSAIALFGFFITAPMVLRLITGALEEQELKISEEITLENPPPIDQNEPPPPPPEIPPPPIKTTVQFTPPVVVDTEDVPEDPPPTQDDLKDVDPGVKTQEGDPNLGVDLSLLEGTENKVTEEKFDDKPFLAVEQMPSFPGGEDALQNYLAKNIKYPQIAKENNITGVVVLQFVVERDGNITDVKVLKPLGGGCDEEAKRVVKSMPNWKPGKQNGKAVPVYYTLPVRFVLQ